MEILFAKLSEVVQLSGDQTIAGNKTFSGSITVNGVASLSGQIQAADGSAAAPAYSFSLDTDLGLYRNATNEISFVAGASRQITFNGQQGRLQLRGDLPSLSWSSAADAAAAPDLFLARDAANTLAQRNGTAAQSFRLYNTFTDGANNEYGTAQWSSNTFEIGTANNGTGVARAMSFFTGGVVRFQITTAGHFTAFTDNAFDIGASGASRLRTGYFGTSVLSPFVRVDNAAVGAAVADSVQVYSSDDAAGHTIPSFFTEGTNVLATGQADSASSVRVKMRINGTVVTLLAI